jgi:hypothetical protein
MKPDGSYTSLQSAAMNRIVSQLTPVHNFKPSCVKSLHCFTFIIFPQTLLNSTAHINQSTRPLSQYAKSYKLFRSLHELTSPVY